ncbi:hypothetical protein ACJX0J_034787, partial [Zea mays]
SCDRTKLNSKKKKLLQENVDGYLGFSRTAYSSHEFNYWEENRWISLSPKKEIKLNVSALAVTMCFHKFTLPRGERKRKAHVLKRIVAYLFLIVVPFMPIILGTSIENYFLSFFEDLYSLIFLIEFTVFIGALELQKSSKNHHVSRDGILLLGSLKEDNIGGSYALSHYPSFALFFQVLGDKRERKYIIRTWIDWNYKIYQQSYLEQTHWEPAEKKISTTQRQLWQQEKYPNTTKGGGGANLILSLIKDVEELTIEEYSTVEEV